MKVLKLILLGATAGLVLAVALAVGAYVSPLRETLYLDFDPEIAGLRKRLDDIRERLTEDELHIAAAPAWEPSADSLKAAQAGALKEYRHCRNRMGELSRLHDKPTPAGFAPWALSLRDALLPGSGILVLLSGLLSAAVGARRGLGRPARMVRPISAQAEALMSFENAVKQVARLSPAAPAASPKEVPIGLKARSPSAPGLSMEDEEGPEADGAEARKNGPAQNQFMPPTTEVERVERRKTEVLKLARKGLTSSEISRRMRISQDQVDFIIRMHREKG